MLPLRDRNPSGTFPAIVYLLIAVNTAVFLLEVGLPQDKLADLAANFGLVPARVSAAWRSGHGLVGTLLVSPFTSMFMHGGWLHLIGNMWFLFLFGDNVEDRLGHGLFLGFYLFCGLAAAATQYALTPQSTVPVIGASGAIAGVLGAYAVTWPRARVLTLVPVFVFLTFIELPALVVLGVWFVIQLLQSSASLGVDFSHGGIAYWAHIGGFLAGALCIKLLPTRRRKRSRAW